MNYFITFVVSNPQISQKNILPMIKNELACAPFPFVILFVALNLLVSQNKASELNSLNSNIISVAESPISNFNDEGECEMKGGVARFSQKSYRLDEGIKKALNNLADDMRNNPACKVVLTGHGNGNKIEQQLSWDQVNSCIEYMVKVQRIDRERLIFIYGEDGEMGVVDFKAASPDQESPDSVPPPFPNLR